MLKINYLRRATVKGVTLIEVLVAMVVLSIGMLGIAGLQVATTKYQQGNRVRGMVAPIFSDIASRIRSNADQAGNNANTGLASISAYVLADSWDTQQGTTLTTPSPDCEATATTCTSTQRASYDMMFWRQRIRAALPSGAALLEGDRSQGFQATIMWFDKDYTDKGKAAASQLIKAPICTTSTETSGSNRMSLQNCCPATAGAPVGVRCNRFTFIP